MPSKKIIILGIILLILVGGGFLLSRNSKSSYDKDNPQVAANISGENLAKSIQEIDSDNDGLKDWEELLWNTDRLSADTDNDGATDGEEVKNSRNPAKPGPDDKIEIEITASSTGRVSSGGKAVEISNTLTSKAGINLFQKYLELKQSGVAVSGDLQEAMVEGLVSDAQSAAPKAKIYTGSDFKIADNINTDDLRNYANSVGMILKNNSPQTSDSEFAVLARIAESQEISGLEKLDPIIRGYQGILNGLTSITVPRPFVNQHSGITTSVGAVLKNIQGFRKMDTDPLLALTELNEYINNVSAMSAAFSNLANSLKQQGLSFSSGEGGYIIMSMTQ